MTLPVPRVARLLRGARWAEFVAFCYLWRGRYRRAIASTIFCPMVLIRRRRYRRLARASLSLSVAPASKPLSLASPPMPRRALR